MTSPKKILIIGNGFGGTYALKALHTYFHKNPNVELSLIGEKNYFLFTPLLHEVATGGINPENIIEPIRKILKCCLKNFYLEETESINLKDKTVKVGDMTIPYDYLILAPGAKTNFYGIKGAEEHSFTLKTLEDAITIKNHAITQMECASHTINEEERKNKLKFLIVGGGPTGVELAAELQELIKENFSRYYSQDVIKDSSVVLMQKGPELMPQFGEKMRKKSLAHLLREGIDVMLNMGVKEVGSSFVVLDNDKKIDTETVIWVGGVKPADLKFDGVVAKDPAGRIIVNEYFQVGDHREVFAIGDVAAFTNPGSKNLVPALAQAAEKEARAVAENIQLIIKSKDPKSFSYHHAGDMVSLGRWMAIGEFFGFTFSGGIAWWIWRTVYLSKLVSFRKKVRVAIDWTINIFTPRDISQF